MTVVLRGIRLNPYVGFQVHNVYEFFMLTSQFGRILNL